MGIQTVKLELMKLILDIKNPNILNEMLSIAKIKQNDFWELLNDSEKEEIETGFNEIERGEKVLYEEFMKKHR